MTHTCAIPCRALSVLAAITLLAAACGDDTPSRIALDAGMNALDGAARGDASGVNDAGGRADDGGSTSLDRNKADAQACPEAGLPARVGCPCLLPVADYCCGTGIGMSCGADGTWSAFYDGPCGQCIFIDADGGLEMNCDIRAEVVDCS